VQPGLFLRSSYSLVGEISSERESPFRNNRLLTTLYYNCVTVDRCFLLSFPRHTQLNSLTDASSDASQDAPGNSAAAIGWQTENSRDVIGQRRPYVVESRRGTVAQLLGRKQARDNTRKYYRFGIKNSLVTYGMHSIMLRSYVWYVGLTDTS